MSDIVINLPTYIKLGKSAKTRFSLNLNTYRNAHFHILNQAKAKFEDIVSSSIRHLTPMKKVDLTYRLFPGSRRAIDIANVCCIVDKFFCDTLVNQGKLIDDNMDVLSKIVYQWGQVDSLDPRIEVTLSNIETIKPEEEPMKIILTHLEIEEALREYVYSTIRIGEDHDVHVDLASTDDGVSTAEIRIGKGLKEGEVNTDVNLAPQAKKRGRPPGSKNLAPRGREPQPEPEEEEVEGEAEEPVEAQAEAPPVASTGNAYMDAQAAQQAPVPAPAPVVTEVAKPAFTTAPAPGQGTIFPNLGSSAPTPTQSPTPATVTPPKSLFANLVKPVNTPAPE